MATKKNSTKSKTPSKPKADPEVEALKKQLEEMKQLLQLQTQAINTQQPAPAAPAPEPAAEPDTKAKTIRNLRNCPVHMRLTGKGDSPYRVVLQARGLSGDIAEVPGACTEDTGFIRSYEAGLFEIITKTEQKAIAYQPTGGAARQAPEVTRESDSVIRSEVVDQTGKPVGPNIVQMPGSDPQMSAAAMNPPTAIMPSHEETRSELQKLADDGLIDPAAAQAPRVSIQRMSS